ncbi:MAG: RNA degradosome polyphosphate kinase [Proteobacteria bacterium]|nr:RNA degradosome polyphosphate kinase [Pseudomonadota bacterium]
MINADFLNSQNGSLTLADLEDNAGAERFFNRELSWLAFNTRVLEVAEDDKIPLLERLRMLSISAKNLDEFFVVRIAGLERLVRSENFERTLDGRTAEQQLLEIATVIDAMMLRQQTCWRDLETRMASNGIERVMPADLSEAERDWLEKKYLDSVLPLLRPMRVDANHPFPFVPNATLTMAYRLMRPKATEPMDVLLPVPIHVKAAYALEPFVDKKTRFILIEDILDMFLEMLFPKCEVLEQCAFRMLRDSNIEIHEDADDLFGEFETALQQRSRGEVMRLFVSDHTASKLRKTIKNGCGVDTDAVAAVDGVLNLADYVDIIPKRHPDLLWTDHRSRQPERVRDFGGNIFAAIKQKDMLLHHPYESFDIVIDFLRQAARDPYVLAIKQTVYRTSFESPIVEALIEAARAGKNVTAMIELKARFDEAANIRQSQLLEQAGVQVVYGVPSLKTHAKASTVLRQEGDDLIAYNHIGTGNYHPMNAKIYTDLSLFTCNKSIARDATKFFNYVSGGIEPRGLENLAISPNTLKAKLLKRIERETTFGAEGQIWAKMNSLVEDEIIDALYVASQAGVKIDLVVRGICALRPGIKGLSENIRVKSIVGRYLEHARIVCFGNGFGLPSVKARVFMTSADWMYRNMSKRVETMAEITNKTVHAQIMSQIMAANLADQRNSWVLQADGAYLKNTAGGKRQFDCHRFFMEHPSLSGRGSVGAKDVPELAHAHDS